MTSRYDFVSVGSIVDGFIIIARDQRSYNEVPRYIATYYSTMTSEVLSSDTDSMMSLCTCRGCLCFQNVR